MSELRFNVISKDWVIIASERAKRPGDFKKAKEAEKIPEYDKNCAFCPGNEDQSKDETFRIGNADRWRVRSIYNKYPALSPAKNSSRINSGIHHFVNGFGVHEVIIEHPKHNLAIPLMADEDVVNILKSYKNRYEALGKKKGIEAITIFKNQGPSAGASQRHPHSQVIATPIVPPQLRNRIASAIAYFDVMGRCVFCDILESELKEGKRIILETEKFVAFIPYAPAGPFLTWIFPRRHTPSFSDIDDVELVDLAKNLKETLARLHYGLDNPDYNYTIRSMPVNEYGREYFHWYLTIVPRITQPAGFELGSGIFINASVPEECAEFLRGVNCP